MTFLKNFQCAAVLVALLAFAVPAQAPQVSLRSTGGATVSSAELQGKVTVLSFGATWVPLTGKELPALQKLADRYAGRGVQVYWVSVNSTKSGAKNFMTDADLAAFAQQRGLRLPVLRDPEQAAYQTFGIDALPTVVILNKDGSVVRKLVGFDPNQSEAYSAVMRELDQIMK